MTHLMDPRDRAPTLIPAYVVAVITVALCVVWWRFGLFDQLGSLFMWSPLS